MDHSEEMVALARERAPGARVVLSERAPFQRASFTAMAMSVVLFLLEDPMSALGECRRVLRAGARIALFTTAPELRGTPAAPEPLARFGRFYTTASSRSWRAMRGSARSRSTTTAADSC